MLALNAWAVEHAALSISVGSAGHKGLTLYYRSGKKLGHPWAAFGSAVWARSGGAWLHGAFVGSRAESQESAIVCGGSLHYTREMKSTVEADWWLDELRRVDPPRPPPGAVTDAEFIGHDAEVEPAAPTEVHPEDAPRRWHVRQTELVRMGFISTNCPGCAAAAARAAGGGARARPHTETCRRRVEAWMNEDPRGRIILDACGERTGALAGRMIEASERLDAQPAARDQAAASLPTEVVADMPMDEEPDNAGPMDEEIGAGTNDMIGAVRRRPLLSLEPSQPAWPDLCPGTLA